MADDLLEKIKKHKSGAYDELLDRYGWKVYRKISEHYGDSEEAKKAFNGIMKGFCKKMSGEKSDDVLESLLFMYAENYCKRDLGEFFSEETSSQSESFKEKKRRSDQSFFRFMQAVVIIAIIVTLWFLCGFLMSSEIIPEIDLGYGWFNENIAKLF